MTETQPVGEPLAPPAFTLDPSDPDTPDFTVRRKVRFRIDHADGTPEYFHGLPDLPAEQLVEFAATMDQLSESELAQQPQIFRAMFELILQEDDSRRFIARMSSRVDPISITQIMNITPWLMEKYGMRPTLPSPSSSPGQPSQVDGTSLTANGSRPALTTDVLVPTGSST